VQVAEGTKAVHVITMNDALSRQYGR